MVGRLIFVLLPYALVVGCLVVLAVAARVIANGAETAPTDVPIAGVTSAAPKADWLHIADGGLYLPVTFMDMKKSKYTRKETPTAYYVPLVSRADADRRAAGGSQQSAPVFVKFSRSEFESRFPNYETATEVDAFTPLDIKGTRSGGFSFSSRFKTYLRDDLRLDPDNVTLIDFDNHPMQRNEAVGLSIFSVLIAAGSVFWIKRRWRAVPAM